MSALRNALGLPRNLSLLIMEVTSSRATQVASQTVGGNYEQRNTSASCI